MILQSKYIMDNTQKVNLIHSIINELLLEPNRFYSTNICSQVIYLTYNHIKQRRPDEILISSSYDLCINTLGQMLKYKKNSFKSGEELISYYSKYLYDSKSVKQNTE